MSLPLQQKCGTLRKQNKIAHLRVRLGSSALSLIWFHEVTMEQNDRLHWEFDSIMLGLWPLIGWIIQPAKQTTKILTLKLRKCPERV